MLGARMHYAVPRILHEEGLLSHFYTDLYVGNKPLLRALLQVLPGAVSPRAVRRLLGRAEMGIPPERVTSFDRLGIWYARSLAKATRVDERDSIYVDAAKRFADAVYKVGLGEASGLYAFNTGAQELFELAKSTGIHCILEQTILPKRLEDELLRDESERWPGVQHGAQTVAGHSELSRREDREWGMADLVIAGSEFVARGLVTCGVSAEKIRVISYGVSEHEFPVSKSDTSSSGNRPLRLLFVGRAGLRKGIPDLVSAVRMIPASALEVRIAGGIDIVLDTLRPPENMTFLGQVSRAEVSDLYQWADLFVMPSILEGSATVTYEALMSGVPVVTTPNAGSMVRDGEDGMIVPVRDAESLARAIQRYASDRTLLQTHRNNAVRDRARVSLRRYRSDLGDLLRGLEQSVAVSAGVPAV